MREIKFRAWDKLYNRMYYMDNCDFILERDGVSVFSEFTKDRINKNWELMQYTGLKDKNGKEIFVGDIVRYDNQIYEIVFSTIGNGVGADEGMENHVGYYLKKDSWYLGLNRRQDLEIIGNTKTRSY